MAMYSPGAKRELTKKKAARLGTRLYERMVENSKKFGCPVWTSSGECSSTSVASQAHSLRRITTFAVLCAPRTRPD